MMLITLLLAWQTAQMGSVEGVVRNSATGAGVARATVYLNAVLGPGMAATAVSDGSGRFVVANLAPGRYRLSVNHSAFPPVRPYSRGGNQEVTIGAGEAVRGVVLSLEPGAVVEGKVMDEDGDAMSNCSVAAERRMFLVDGTGGGSRRISPAGQAMTNDLGEYRIFDLQAGNYYFNARCEAKNTFPAEADEAEVWLEQYYPSLASLEGATATRLAPGAERRGVDFRMRRGKAVAVRGKLAGLGKEQRQGLSILLHRRDTQDPRSVGAVMKEDGAFYFTGVRPGSYHVVARSHRFNPNDKGLQLAGEADVVVGDRPPKPFTVEMKPLLAIRGQLEVDGETGGEPQIWLQAVGADGCGSSGAAKYSGGGAFVFDEVAPGDCVVSVGLPRGYVKSISFGGEAVVGRKVRIGSGAAGPLRIVVSSKVATIEGRVNGERHEGFVIVGAAEGGEGQHIGAFGEQGQFVVGNLAPGEYRVLAVEGTELQGAAALLFRLFASRAAKAKVEESGRATVQVEMIGAKEAAEAIEGEE